MRETYHLRLRRADGALEQHAWTVDLNIGSQGELLIHVTNEDDTRLSVESTSGETLTLTVTSRALKKPSTKRRAACPS